MEMLFNSLHAARLALLQLVTTFDFGFATVFALTSMYDLLLPALCNSYLSSPL